MTSKPTALLALIAAGAWCIAPMAHAQTDPTSPATSPNEETNQTMPPSQTTPGDAPTDSAQPGMTADGGAPEIDQRKIEQFADAYVEVQTIQQQANAELASAADPAQADNLQSSAQSDMIAAVERSGLQIEEFNHIVASMATDTELRSKVSAEVQKRAGAASPSGGS